MADHVDARELLRRLLDDPKSGLTALALDDEEDQERFLSILQPHLEKALEDMFELGYCQAQEMHESCF